MAWFMKIDGIKGESVQAPDHLEIQHWQNGADLPMHSAGGTAGSVKGESNIHDLQVTATADKSSVELLKACLGGTPLKKIELIGKKDLNKKTVDYYKATFEECFISSINFGTGAENQMSPVSFSINFAKVEHKYFVFDTKGGGAGDTTCKYDAKTHKLA